MTKTGQNKSILFVCTGNSCRSQMAEGFARSKFPKGWSIYSAGTIAAGVHPMTIEVMREAGIDISKQYSKTIEEVPTDDLGYLITLCGDARDRCPGFLRRLSSEHWPIADPISSRGDHDTAAAFRRVRDDIKKRVETLVKSLCK